MLKSAKLIRVSSRLFKSIAGVMVTPKLNLQGMVLSSATPIPKEVTDFFSSKGAKIEFLEEDGDRLLRLTGSFEISAEEVQKFLSKYPSLNLRGSSAADELKETKEVADAVNFQRQVAARFKAVRASMTPDIQIQYTFCALSQSLIETPSGNVETASERTPLYSTILPHFCVEKIMDFKSTKGTLQCGAGASIISGEATNMQAGTDISIGGPPEPETRTGFLAEMTSRGPITMESKANSRILNAVFQAGGAIEMLAGDTVEIAYEHDAYWANPPFIPSLVFAYEAAVTTPRVSTAAAANAPATATVKAAAPFK